MYKGKLREAVEPPTDLRTTLLTCRYSLKAFRANTRTGAKALKDVTFQWLVSILDLQQGPEKVEERMEAGDLRN